MKEAPGNICPACGGDVPNTEHKGKYPGALSRVDNETEICSACGLSEALGMRPDTRECVDCGRWVPLTSEGALVKHGVVSETPDRCPGSGRSYL